MQPGAPAPVVAVLGPTNTGKTHRAVQAMLEHDSGMIGVPLRRLAREVYDRITPLVGESAVALVTGEEKRIPPRPRFWVCTVEAMPMDRAVDFLAVDEIQLAAHAERGHVFTDRLLHARGRKETWFMGADTMRPMFRALLPQASIQSHPRLSRLSGVPPSTLGGLPPRSAVVAFSMARVYEIAERIRHRRGGAAVVLGALSPRARNAQVGIYQAGEVDYLVATDAIGMGLNLDVSHVAFADLRKFDGRDARELTPAELAQIAGRAGRHLSDGSFGVLSPTRPLPHDVVRSIERHQFPPERTLVWRSAELDTSSLDALVRSLKRGSPSELLRLVDRADDFATLVELTARPEIRELADAPERVALLWDLCQIPDYRQLLISHHANLVAELFAQLTGKDARLDRDWLERRIRRLDDDEGDIDTLLSRMAFVRTWTYVTSHGGWVQNAAELQARTRAIEDRLSDALHQRLVERFVKQTSKSATSGPSRAARRTDKSNPFERLEELRAKLFGQEEEPSTDALSAALDAEHSALSVDALGRVSFEGQSLGRLSRGSDVLHPDVRVDVEGTLSAGVRLRLTRRLTAFGRDLVEDVLAPLRDARLAEVSPAARGLVYQLEQGLGTAARKSAADQIAALTADDRRILNEAGVRLGQRYVYLPARVKPRWLVARSALWSAYASSLPLLPGPSQVSIVLSESPARELDQSYLTLGYPVIAGRAIRVDVAERIASRAREPEGAARDVARWLGTSERDATRVLAAVGRRSKRPRRRRRAKSPPAES